MAVDGARFRWWWLLVAAAIVLAAWLAWSAWRGPLLPGYVVAEGPLVQSVVATGRVAAPSRVQVGAEVTGLVLERPVMEGDRVAPGDVLLVLSAAELEARLVAPPSVPMPRHACARSAPNSPRPNANTPAGANLASVA
jgi:multidrug efflux pump subunit AcrA (membrane-fusion protein)